MAEVKKKFQLKPISTAKAVVAYIVCFALIAAMLAGNYFADAYRELITVYLSGSGTVTTAESEALCLEIEEEGMVLLKNDGALPLKEGAAVTLLGQDSVDFVYGGAGSGSVDTSKAPTLKQGLEKYGFTVNPTLWEFYSTGAGKGYRKSVPDETGDGDFAVNEVPQSVYTSAETGSFGDYHDAAIVCIGRSGGESADIPTAPLASGYKYLELDRDELDLLTMACQSFDTVVVLLNANNPLELGFLEDPAYANVKACLWVGGVGQEGIYAIGEALSGKVNPSGHLSDTYAYDSLSAPSVTSIPLGSATAPWPGRSTPPGGWWTPTPTIPSAPPPRPTWGTTPSPTAPSPTAASTWCTPRASMWATATTRPVTRTRCWARATQGTTTTAPPSSSPSASA